MRSTRWSSSPSRGLAFAALPLLLALPACGGDAEAPELAGAPASAFEPELAGDASSLETLTADGDDLVATFGGRFVRLTADGARVELASVPMDGPARTLAFGGERPAIFGEHVYFGSLRQSSLGRLPRAGGAPELLAASAAAFNFFPGPLAARTDALFVGTAYGDAALWAFALDGASAQPLVDLGEAYPKRLWADAQRLVWTDDVPSVKALDLAQGTRAVPEVRTLAAGLAFDARSAVANDDAVFLPVLDGAAALTSVRRVPKAGGAATVVVEVAGGAELAVDGAHLWVRTQSRDDDFDYVVREYALAGEGAAGAGREVARSKKPLSHLTATAGYVVWLDAARGQLRRAPKGGETTLR